MGGVLLHSHNTKTTTWLDPRLCKKAKAPEDCEDGGEMFRIPLSAVAGKRLSLSELDTVCYCCGGSFSLVHATGAGSVELSVPSLVATGVHGRLGKSTVYFPWSSRI